jgi:alpha-aminoadipic semialdehyde synthase
VESEDSPPRPALLNQKKKRVLLLGSGLVAGPAVDVFVARGDVELLIGMSYLKGLELTVSQQQSV